MWKKIWGCMIVLDRAWARLTMIPGSHGLGVCEPGTKERKHLPELGGRADILSAAGIKGKLVPHS